MQADRVFGALWLGLGGAIAIASWRMDRLAGQGVEPYSVPGLLPGLLGTLLALLGLVLACRRPVDATGEAPAAAEPWRIVLALALCGGFVLVALGRVPFPLAAFAFVFAAIILFELPDRRRDGTLARGALQAGLVAAGAAAAVTLVFQEVFLVRLP